MGWFAAIVLFLVSLTSLCSLSLAFLFAYRREFHFMWVAIACAIFIAGPFVFMWFLAHQTHKILCCSSG